MNAWPALQTVVRDGWVYRFAQGFSRRANSVAPLHAPAGALSACIDEVEATYARLGVASIFKMTDAAQPEGLDDALEARGYRVDAPTSVLVRDLGDAGPDGGAAASLPVDVQGRATSAWLDAQASMTGIRPRYRTVHAQILDRIVPEQAVASITLDGAIVACGLGVVQAGWIGIFDVVAHPAYRRRGLARRLCSQLLELGRQRGASRAYLLVMTDNAAALTLYASLGFREAYRYWYRCKP